MLDEVRQVLGNEEAWVVGGAVRDELMGRVLVDLDIACREPQQAAHAYQGRAGGAVFPLSERHGAWRVAFRDGRTVDFTPLPAEGIEADLATRDFTINAIARTLAADRDEVDPFGGRADIEAHRLRAVSETVFEDDPLRLLRAVRFEQLGFRLDDHAEGLVRRHADLVTRPAGERILGELAQLNPASFRRLDELGLLEPLGGSLEKLDRVETRGAGPLVLIAAFGESLLRLPISNELARYARTLLRAELPPDLSARSIHRFRRATEPWALDALTFLGARVDAAAAVEEARRVDPAEPLVRGDELGLPPGPEIGRLLDRIAEERAAGTISTREEALELARREAQR
jgi:tRNA nucleotidyltransferase/poly(A) polymerase